MSCRKNVPPQAIVEAVERAGLGAELVTEDSPKSDMNQSFWQQEPSPAAYVH